MHLLFKAWYWSVALLATLSFLIEPAALATGEDAQRGAQIFQQCAVCHSVRPGVHLTGPSLAHVWSQKAGTAKGFGRYSDALKNSDVTWTEQTLDKWLTNPAIFIPRNAMMFPGIASSNARHDVIAYLRAVSEGKSPYAVGGGRGMMGGGKRPNLKAAPPKGQVTSIEHCGDTYTITSGNGETTKVWEFNLRFKTDSSADGPYPGKPVAIGAGMRGDRASVIFASPSEISSFIRESCR